MPVIVIKFQRNTIAGNSEAGIILPDCMCGGCNHNSIYHNNFINNGYHAGDNCNNNWDAGYPSGGNFWDNYYGVDNFSGPNQNIPGSDSIGDTPYYILGGNEEDFYPLMYPVGMPPFADVVYVDDDFDENTPGWGFNHFDCIMDGINLTANNGSVHVANGVYYENISINKKLSLFGEEIDSTIIDGNGAGTALFSTADSIVITGFKFQNSGMSAYGVRIEYSDRCSIYGNMVTNCYHGISINNSIGARIINNSINNCLYGGLWITDSDSILIKQNEIAANRYGFGMSYSNNIIISGNKISENGIDGGMLIQYSNNNHFLCNTISDNDDYGIFIKHHSNNNILKGNMFIGNSTYGIRITESSNNNLIYHNILKDNVTSNAYDECSNTWHNGYRITF